MEERPQIQNQNSEQSLITKEFVEKLIGGVIMCNGGGGKDVNSQEWGLGMSTTQWKSNC